MVSAVLHSLGFKFDVYKPKKVMTYTADNIVVFPTNSEQQLPNDGLAQLTSSWMGDRSYSLMLMSTNSCFAEYGGISVQGKAENMLLDWIVQMGTTFQ